MANKKKSASGKSSKKKNTQKKNYLPSYIITMIMLTLLFSVFMYIDYGEGGIINKGIKTVFCGLFGICGFFVPVITAGLTAYLVKTKNIEGFWKKTTYILLILINISALINLASGNNDIAMSMYLGHTDYSGGGLLGGCVSVLFVNMVQTIASYIILSLTLIVLASLITNISIFSEIAKLIKGAATGARNKYDELREDYGQRILEKEEYTYNTEDTEDILNAANSFASDIQSDKKNDIQNKKKKSSSQAKETKKEEFSNGIDDIFGDMPEINAAANTEVSSDTVHQDILVSDDTMQEEEKKAESAEKTGKISQAEKDAYNEEFNKAIEKPVIEYVYPKLSLLNKPKNVSGDKREEMRRTAEKLISVLDDFGVKAKLMQVTQGPAVTRYEIQPDTGVKLSKIVGLADDIALNLAVSTVLVAAVPGKAAVGIEIPNNKVSAVSIREILESNEFKSAKSKLTVALGKDIGGNVVVGDIAKMPHLLIAGATGSGKSVCINTMIMSILYKASPEDIKMIMIDPKVVELGVYNGIPHLLVPVVTEPKKAAGALNWAVTEMMRRYELFKDTGVRKLESYNKLMDSRGEEKIPQLVVIIDELADLMMVAAKEVEDYIVRLTQLARAAGIYLIIATQRPSVDVITGLIKANVPSRIAFAVSSQVDSRTILDKGGAEKLLGRGDMLYHPSGARASTRVQGAFVDDSEIEKVLEFIKENVGETHYSDDLAEEIERHATGENGVTPDVEEDGDELLPEAIELALNQGKISTSSIQRRLSVGYSRAGRIIDQMEARGIISGANGSKPRDVLVSRADLSMAEDEADEYREE